jgi:hypothetical protein
MLATVIENGEIGFVFLLSVQQPLRNPVASNSHFSVAGHFDRPNDGQAEQCHQGGH